MGNIAIKGHSTRGDDVINILERFGAKNNYKLTGDANNAYYVIENNEIKCGSVIFGDEPYVFFTVEEFLSKYPYSINEKVVVLATKKVVTIEGMTWRNGCEVIYETCYNDDCVAFYSVEELQPYEELSFGECIEKTINECLFGGDEETMVKENYSPIKLLPLGSKVMIVPTNEDSEIIEENGKFYLVKKQQQYPKNYDECCEVLSIPSYYKLRYYTYEHGYNEYTTLNKLCSLQDKLNILGKLLICRDAYWKIAGEEMGLDEPWNQDYNDRCFIIANNDGNIHTYEYHGSNNVILAFPTKEMRDDFYENFKDLIEECKDLL